MLSFMNLFQLSSRYSPSQLLIYALSVYTVNDSEFDDDVYAAEGIQVKLFSSNNSVFTL